MIGIKLVTEIAVRPPDAGEARVARDAEDGVAVVERHDESLRQWTTSPNECVNCTDTACRARARN